jgi:putative ABC transport system substrate-binding protein
MASSACTLFPFKPAERRPRIGVLVTGSREQNADRLDAFTQGLRSAGYVEGQTIAIEWRFTQEGSVNQFAALAAELVAQPVDLIVVEGTTTATLAVKKATTTIPIVFTSALTSPVDTGLVASLARPGGNTTGLTSSAPGAFAKWVELLREVVPGVARPAALVFPANPTTVAVWDEFRIAGEAVGLDVQRVDLHSPDDVDVAFEEAASHAADAVVVAAIALLLPVRERVGELALRHRLPGISVRDFTTAGLLMSYGANPLVLRRRAAAYVAKILNGAKPADLPVEQPTVFDLVVNVKTMNTLGLTIPPSVEPLVTEWVE